MAHQDHPTVYFDPGVYFLGSATSTNAQLFEEGYDPSHPFTLNLIGNGATVSTSQADQDGVTGFNKILAIFGYWQHSTIQGITFVNTHGITTNPTGALDFAGSAPEALLNIRIVGNVFKNFSRHVAIVNATDLTVSANSFLMEQGRDSGTSTNLVEPNVGLWLFNDSTSRRILNVVVSGNTYDGCSNITDLSGTHSQSHSCGDGLLFGSGSNVNVLQNVISHFSFEGIYLQPGQSGDIGANIRYNSLDGTVVLGDANGGGQWAIRCDLNGSNVHHNSIINAVTGLLTYGVDMRYSTTSVNGVFIHANNIITSALNADESGPNAQRVSSGINVVALDSSTISNNLILFNSPASNTDEISGLYLSGGSPSNLANDNQLYSNTIISRVQPPSTTTSGFFLQWMSNWTIAGNWYQNFTNGVHSLNQTFTTSEYNAIINNNTFISNVMNFYIQ